MAVPTQLVDLKGNTVALDTIKSGATSLTLTGNAGTATSYIVQCTTPSLTTAAGANQAETVTMNGVTSSDLAFVTAAGGTNTVNDFNLIAVCTANTVTVTIANTGPTAALNGTIIFNLWVLKA